jgi:predicted nucleic acid-binding protein
MPRLSSPWRIGQVELLTLLHKLAAIPHALADELMHASAHVPARRAVESGLFKIIKTPVPPSAIQAWDLGPGESAVLSYALAHPCWIAVLDDGAARRCARSLSIVMTGTLAVVLLARQNGLIESAARVLHALRAAEFRLDEATIRTALERTVGETWETEQ